MVVLERKRQVRNHGYCANCFARSHKTDECTSSDVCKRCGWGHHTLLHVSPRSSRAFQPNDRSLRRVSRTQRKRVHDRLGSHRRPAPPNRRPSNRLAAIPSTNNQKRILKCALRALERLVKAI